MLTVVEGPSDATLAQRVRVLEDRHAFSTLVRRHQAPVRGFARRLCAGDSARADDISQEAFLLAWRHLASWRGEGTLRSWLLKLCDRAFLTDARRAHHRREDIAAEPDARPVTPPEVGVRRDVLRALAELEPAQRAALALCFTLGLTHEEAARVLDVPLGTLKSHVARGKERLQALLPGYAPEAA